MISEIELPADDDARLDALLFLQERLYGRRGMAAGWLLSVVLRLTEMNVRVLCCLFLLL